MRGAATCYGSTHFPFFRLRLFSRGCDIMRVADRVIGLLTILSFALQAGICVMTVVGHDNVPLHWDARGNADEYGNAYNILLLPVVSVFVYFLLTFFKRHPGYCNWPHKFNDVQAGLRLLGGLIAALRLLAVTFLTFIAYEAYCGGIFNYAVALAFLVAAFIAVFVYALKLRKA